MTTALTTERLALRVPEAPDAAALRDYHVRNRERFAPWEPLFSDDVDEHARWIAAREAEARRAGYAASFLVFAGDVLAGQVNLIGFSSEPPPSAMLTYTIDGAFEGRGYAAEAVGRVVRYAFEQLALMRLWAHYHPANVRSERLLERLGFDVVARTPVIPGLEALMRPHVYARLSAPDAD